MSVGEQFVREGDTPQTGRQGSTGETIVGQAHGKYYEASRNGRLAFGCTTAGIATTTSISTTSMISIHNPFTSAHRIAILQVSVGYHSGTLGAGTLFHCANPAISGTANTVPSGGTTITSYYTDIQGDFGRSPVGVFISGSTVVAPKQVRPLCSVNAILATTATGIFTCIDDVNGAITLSPGGVYQVQSVCAAGTSPLLNIGVIWEEIPLVLPVR
jgi:hypothetical protein